MGTQSGIGGKGIAFQHDHAAWMFVAGAIGGLDHLFHVVSGVGDDHQGQYAGHGDRSAGLA
ncbi:Uncharacterised protein [Mycobacteroides abscessus subsp. massiliense]|nr:Uncharacterised protein [Mycobacteroides abscessus subsp. massiliense]